jgi:hypothetical protein
MTPGMMDVTNIDVPHPLQIDPLEEAETGESQRERAMIAFCT